MCAVYQDLTPKFSLWDLFTADLQINQSFEHIHQEIWLEAAYRSRYLRHIIGWFSNVIWRRESARNRPNLTSGVQFVPLPLVNPVVWFARTVVNRRSRSVAKLRRYKRRKAKNLPILSVYVHCVARHCHSMVFPFLCASGCPFVIIFGFERHLHDTEGEFFNTHDSFCVHPSVEISHLRSFSLNCGSCFGV